MEIELDENRVAPLPIKCLVFIAGVLSLPFLINKIYINMEAVTYFLMTATIVNEVTIMEKIVRSKWKLFQRVSKALR